MKTLVQLKACVQASTSAEVNLPAVRPDLPASWSVSRALPKHKVQHPQNTKSLSLLLLLRKRCRQAGVHQPEDKTDTATQQPTGQAAAAAISTICRKTKQPVTSITTC